MIKQIINLIKHRTEAIYLKPSFSTNGEDILIDTILRKIQKGIYIDIGAHHPYRFSNTYLLYKRGWRGVNIDANIKSIDLFKKYRKEDINITAAISEKKELLTFYSNKLGALNTLDKNKFEGNPDKFKAQKEIKTSTLKEVLNNSYSSLPEVHFLNIDIEGFDLKALKSFPWEYYKPNLICVEDLEYNPEEPSKSEIYNFMLKQGYKFYALIPKTLFFIPK